MPNTGESPHRALTAEFRILEQPADFTETIDFAQNIERFRILASEPNSGKSPHPSGPAEIWTLGSTAVFTEIGQFVPNQQDSASRPFRPTLPKALTRLIWLIPGL